MTKTEKAVAITGLKAAGKDTLANLLKERGFTCLRTSDAIRDDLGKRGNADPTTQELIARGNEGRAESGDNGYWMKRLAEMGERQGLRLIAFNGVRHPEEFARLKEIYGNRLVVAGVVAPTPLRARRFLKRKQAGDPSEFEAFLKIDDTDRGIGEPPHGQHVDRALAQVPYENVYNNVGALEDFSAWVDALLERNTNTA